MNRILERRYILKDEVAEKFRLLMRQVEAFTGVQVVTYCIMTNPVHLLLRVPERIALSDKDMLSRLEQVSSPGALAQFMDLWNRMVEQKSETGLDELRHSVLARMFDVSTFMKELQQRFTQWYNQRARRRLRWLTDGAVIGSKDFVAEMRVKLRDKLGFKRSVGAYPAEESEHCCSLRDLRGE